MFLRVKALGSMPSTTIAIIITKVKRNARKCPFKIKWLR